MDESLALLLLPGQLEGLSIETHARSLLSIPRVVALEPSRFRAPRFVRNAAALRQAARIWLPGTLRLVVLYHPAQYPLARALCGRADPELWYIPPDSTQLELDSASDPELLEFDEAARARANRTLAVDDGTEVDDAPLRDRLSELDVISPRAFVPDAQFRRLRGPRKGPTRGP